MNQSLPITQYGSPRFARIAAIFAMLFSLACGIGTHWVAFTESPGFYWALPLWYGMTAAWYFFILKWNLIATFYPDKLVVTRWLRRWEFPYEDIIKVDLLNQRLSIKSERKKIVFFYHNANLHAQLYRELKKRVPYLKKQTVPPLPYTVYPFRTSAIIYFWMGVGMVWLAFGLTNYALESRAELPLNEWLFPIIFSGLLLLIGGFMIYAFGISFIYSYTFTPEGITEQYFWKKNKIPIYQLKRVHLRCVQRKVKQMPRQEYILDLTLQDDSIYEFKPNSISFPIEYAEENEQIRLQEIEKLLRTYYMK